MTFDQNRSVLAGISQQTLQTWLLQAQTALQQVNTGGMAKTVVVTGGGQHREVTFNQSNVGNLTLWINELNAALGNRRHARRPITFRFS